MFKKLAFLSPTLLFIAISANAENTSLPMGRVQFSATGANAGLGILSGDALLPFYGDNTTGFFYADAAGDHGTDVTYLASPGLGYRGIHNNQIFGAYFFDDYQKTSLGPHFWVLSPGVEWITPEWDAHANAYFPTTTQQQSGAGNFAENFGNYDYKDWPGDTNTIYDAWLIPYSVIGNGADASVGYSFDLNGDHLRSRIALGSYYYQAPSNTDISNITGLTASYSNALTKNFSVSLANSYDQLNHYKVSVSLTYAFGGESNTFSKDIADRLLDPVERHTGVIDTGAGQYDQQYYDNTGQRVFDDHAYAFAENGTGVGTPNDPMAFTQDNVDAVAADSPDGANFYLAPGEYDVNVSTATTQTVNGSDESAIFLHTKQSIFGTNESYDRPATSNSDVMIMADEGYGGLVMIDGTYHTISDVTVTASAPGSNTGIIISDSTGSNVINLDNIAVTNFSTGVSAMNSGTSYLTINARNSEFSNNVATGTGSDDIVASGFSINNTSSGDLIMNAINSHFDSNEASTTNADAMAYGFGVYIVNSGTSTVTFLADNSTFDNNTAAGTVDGAGSIAAGVYASNRNSGDVYMTLNNSTFNRNSATNANSNAYGVDAVNLGSGTLTLQTAYSEFNYNRADDLVGVYAAGLSASNVGTGKLNITTNHAEFNNNSSLAYGAYGMYVVNEAGAGNVEINAIDSHFDSNTRDGLYVENDSTIGALTAIVSGSSFNNNARYGIYDYADAGSTTTVSGIDSATLSGNGIAATGSGGTG